MKKIKYIALMVIMIMVATLAVNNVYAEDIRADIVTIETDRELYYEGETINLNLKFTDEYYTKLDSNKKVTDFEIGLNEVFDEYGNMGRGIPVTPVLEGAQYSEEHIDLYYIQLAELAQKIKFVGGEHIANAKDEIPQHVFGEEGFAEGNEHYLNFMVIGEYNFDDNTIEYIYGVKKTVKVVQYITGDFNRDHEIDFFDITGLISFVYETSYEELETLDWRKKEAITSNTKEYTTDESYDYKTAELGFRDIIYLVREVYG